MPNLAFSDAVTYDGQMKAAISVRDGVLEYLGSELGMSPADKIFYVYRSPATIASAARCSRRVNAIGSPTGSPASRSHCAGR